MINPEFTRGSPYYGNCIKFVSRPPLNALAGITYAVVNQISCVSLMQILDFIYDCNQFSIAYGLIPKRIADAVDGLGARSEFAIRTTPLNLCYPAENIH